MSSRVVAKIWWEAPHDEVLERFVFEDQQLHFGRHSSADIRFGHAPVRDTTVPRVWGRISWHLDGMIIKNLDDKWGFDLVPADASAKASRITVAAGVGASPNAQWFEIVAQAPGSTHRLKVMTADPRQFRSGIEFAATAEDPKSFNPIKFTATQRLIGETILAHHRSGRARRPSYQELARDTDKAVSWVRENIQIMDAKFILYGFHAADERSDALDRVTDSLIRHPGCLR